VTNRNVIVVVASAEASFSVLPSKAFVKKKHQYDPSCASSFSFLPTTIRGGSNEEEEEVKDDTLTSSSSQRSRRSPLSSPFYMNEVARYEASVAAADSGEQTTERGDEPMDQREQQTSPRKRRVDKQQQDGHMKRKKMHARRDKESKMQENDSLAPALRETREKSDDEPPMDTPVKQQEDGNAVVHSAAANLWWVNMWTQQIMSDDEEEGRRRPEEGHDHREEEMPAVDAELFMVESSSSSSDVDSNTEEEPSEKEEMDTTLTPRTVVTEPVDVHTDALVPTAHDDLQSNNTTLSKYVSSGIWGPVDNLITLGLASRYSSLRISQRLRPVRKWTAHVTGLHGVFSGKPSSLDTTRPLGVTTMDRPTDRDLQGIQKRIAAIDRARKSVDRVRAVDVEDSMKRRRGLFGGLFRARRNETSTDMATAASSSHVDDDGPDAEEDARVMKKSPEEIEEERQRMERVKEIDRLIAEGQALLQNLICEKDVLQRRPNPLFEYKTVKTTKKKVPADTDLASNETVQDTTVNETVEVQATRKMNFPPDELVAEYLDMMISTRRLVKMNHTFLWQESESSEDEEETIGDDLFTASADAHRLYQDSGRPPRGAHESNKGKNGNGNAGIGGGGSWLLRQSLGGGPSLGEKIGEAAETAAYKAVCAALMSFLAKLLSTLHGVNVLKHSDIRLVLEQAPDLPMMGAEGILPGTDGNYAEETLKTVMRQKTKKRRKYSKHRPSDDSFVQRDAVTEMLLSHVQISAPLLKLFPLAWQRALLGNIVTLATAVISDFLDGLRFQILGHELSFAFRPITEEDMIRHFQIMSGGRLNHRKYKAAEFEAAVRATAEDVSEELKFLDRWHERALGSGVLRTQIANLIARIVLTLTDEILSAARIDLWSAQAGGPRMLAGLEYRVESIDAVEEVR
jgi:hypothetical protein